MKLRQLALCIVAAIASALAVGCASPEEEIVLDEGYGYVQFKLYKAASYSPAATRSGVVDIMELLGDAYKVQVTLSFEEDFLSQTLTLSRSSNESAEYGLRSNKLKLLTGNYTVVNFTLYDALDQKIYVGQPTSNASFEVVEGGLTIHDLTVNVQQRGKVQFTIRKDMSDFEGSPYGTRAASRQYTFDEIAMIDITLRNQDGNNTTISGVECDFDEHFNLDDDVEDGYKTSSLVCDTLVWIPAGKWSVVAYSTYDEDEILLEENTNPTKSEFTITDNATTNVNVNVRLYEADEYIKDYYALKAIWDELDGPNWYYVGEDYPAGTNWDFNKDVDLWGAQPGVQVHSNGRVARLDLSNFAFRGDMPAAIGQLTELIELYLGTHNDTNTSTYDPSLDYRKYSLSERNAMRMELHKEFLGNLHTPVQMSEPCARALAEHNIEVPEMKLYKTMAEEDIIDRQTGHQKEIKPMDTAFGTLCNGLKSLPKEIGNLKKLEYLYIANSTIESLPAELAELESCTDFEIYNCPNLTKFPMAVAEMPELVSVNISNNAQWSAEELYKGLNAMANGPSKEKLQILYARENNLKEVPESFKNFKKIGLLDLAYNQIEKIHPFGKGIAPTQFYLDHNNLTEIPRDEDGLFCDFDDVETFSVNFNKLTKVPNIFDAKSIYTMSSVSFAGNQITGFEGEDDGTYKGIRCTTFTLSQNPLQKYPTCLAESESIISYIILRACQIEEVPEGSFTSDKSIDLMSMDLSYNYISELPKDMHAGYLPYLYGVDLSYNSFSKFPYQPLDAPGLTVFAIRAQRDKEGNRCLKQWPTGIYQHVGLRGLYLGSNDLREVNDTISHLCYYLEISDNPNIVFDASDICYYWSTGAYILIYDKTQNILNCSYMLE